MPRPIGTAIPHPPVYALANFDPSDITGSIGAQLLGDPAAPLQFPKVNRKNKARLADRAQREPMPPLPPVLGDRAGAAGGKPKPPSKMRQSRAGRFDPYSQYEFRRAARRSRKREPAKPHAPVQPVTGANRTRKRRVSSSARDPLAPAQEASSLGAGRGAGRSSRTPAIPTSSSRARAGRQAGDDNGGESVANKGEVTGDRRAAEIAGRAAGAHRQGAREGGEMSRQRGLFRSARRAGARPDRRRASRA